MYKKNLSEIKPFFVIQEDEGIFNIFCIADFDKDGYYGDHNGEDGYHISDFDIVAEFRSWKDAERYMDEHDY